MFQFTALHLYLTALLLYSILIPKTGLQIQQESQLYQVKFDSYKLQQKMHPNVKYRDIN